MFSYSRRKSHPFMYQKNQERKRIQLGNHYRRYRYCSSPSCPAVCMGSPRCCAVRFLRTWIYCISIPASSGKRQSYKRRSQRLVPETQKCLQMYRLQADRRYCNGSCCNHARRKDIRRYHLRLVKGYRQLLWQAAHQTKRYG